MMSIVEGCITEALTFEGLTMVQVDFCYPIVSSDNKKADRRINAYYRQLSKTLLKKAKNELFTAAVDEWRYAIENSYPFRAFESTMKYTVTTAENDILSLFYDVYDYMGGAHGMTKRFGDTWRASTGWFVELADFFPRGTNYKRILIENAVKIATRQISERTHQYFDHYPKLIRKYFNPSKFYCLPASVIIFYDQYAIAPYSDGIPTFEYTYSDQTLQP